MTVLKYVPPFIQIARDEVMRTNILSGKKKITIREGHRDYRPGLAVIACHLDPWAVMVDITDVKHCTLADITPEEWESDGFTSQQNLLEGMRQFYPNLTFESPVTVIRWDNTRGALVDEYQAR